MRTEKYEGKEREKFLEIMHAVAIKRWYRARCKRVRNVVRAGSIAALFSLSACGLAMPPKNGVLFMGTPEGIRAWNDGQSGLIINGKAKEGANDTPYYQQRREHEKEITQRETAPDWMTNIFNGGAK